MNEQHWVSPGDQLSPSGKIGKEEIGTEKAAQVDEKRECTNFNVSNALVDRLQHSTGNSLSGFTV